jgi:hypothetical protein
MDLIFSVDGDGDPWVRLPNPNHPHDPPPVVKHHCTDDIRTAKAWGYAGSGPADVALNTLHLFIPLEPGEQGTETWDGSQVSPTAERLFQGFKEHFLTRMPASGGIVTEAETLLWLANQGVFPSPTRRQSSGGAQ